MGKKKTKVNYFESHFFLPNYVVIEKDTKTFPQKFESEKHYCQICFSDCVKDYSSLRGHNPFFLFYFKL